MCDSRSGTLTTSARVEALTEMNAEKRVATTRTVYMAYLRSWVTREERRG